MTTPVKQVGCGLGLFWSLQLLLIAMWLFNLGKPAEWGLWRVLLPTWFAVGGVLLLWVGAYATALVQTIIAKRRFRKKWGGDKKDRIQP